MEHNDNTLYPSTSKEYVEVRLTKAQAKALIRIITEIDLLASLRNPDLFRAVARISVALEKMDVLP